MSDFKVLIKKGYNIEISSWENDADNFKTKTYNVETLKFAFAILKMCKELFETYHDGKQILRKYYENLFCKTTIYV